MDGAKLKAARLRKGFTQDDLAEVIKVGTSSIRRWENGENTPQPIHMQQLCDTLDITVEELLSITLGVPAGLAGTLPHIELPASLPRKLQVFMQQDLTMRLWSLHSEPYQTYQEIHTAMARILKDFDSMNENRHINRREAFLRLVSLAFTPAFASALKSEEVPSATVSRDILTQCAIGIAACWELRKSSEPDDLALAFEGVSAYLPVLQRIVKDSSEHRREAARLVMQCLLLKSRLAQHLENLIMAISYAQQALSYSEAAQDVSLHLQAFEKLAGSYVFGKQYQQALQTMQYVEPFLKRKDVMLPLVQQASLSSMLACTLVRNRQEGSVYLEQAGMLLQEKGNEYPVHVTYNKAGFLLDQGIVYSYQGESQKAMAVFSQVVDPETLTLKLPWGEENRVEIINFMAMTSLRDKDRNMGKTTHFWKAGIEGAKALRSELRFSEAVNAYDLMEYVWPGEKHIVELRDLIQHW